MESLEIRRQSQHAKIILSYCAVPAAADLRQLPTVDSTKSMGATIFTTQMQYLFRICHFTIYLAHRFRRIYGGSN